MMSLILFLFFKFTDFFFSAIGFSVISSLEKGFYTLSMRDLRTHEDFFCAMTVRREKASLLTYPCQQVQSKKDPECVKVVVRCRPMSRKETEDGRARIVEMDQKTGEVLCSVSSSHSSTIAKAVVRETDASSFILFSQVLLKNPEADPREQPKPFTFDQVRARDHAIFDS